MSARLIVLNVLIMIFVNCSAAEWNHVTRKRTMRERVSAISVPGSGLIYKNGCLMILMFFSTKTREIASGLH